VKKNLAVTFKTPTKKIHGGAGAKKKTKGDKSTDATLGAGKGGGGMKSDCVMWWEEVRLKKKFKDKPGVRTMIKAG